MSIQAENNKKTEDIKASLEILLEELENKKQMIATRNSCFYKIVHYFQRDKLELLNRAACILNKLNNKFHSFDDFNSIKKLRQTELFFKNPVLKEFAFFSYKSQIDSNLLDYVNIEIKLDKLSKKADDLYRRGYHVEGIIANGVENDIRNLNRWHFEKKLIDPNDYKTRALAIIDKARPTLEQHRGCKRILINLIALISTLGFAFIVNKGVNNRFLFCPETKSSEQLTKLEHSVSKLNY
ncbi:MAG: hypothetical protein E6K54_07310 [Gammaproteobacteria bacterium]|nr:MAG: hypothetical protein E6K54_07310 [Gammaproteobacteria bacterium]